MSHTQALVAVRSEINKISNAIESAKLDEVGYTAKAGAARARVGQLEKVLEDLKNSLAFLEKDNG